MTVIYERARNRRRRHKLILAATLLATACADPTPTPAVVAADPAAPRPEWEPPKVEPSQNARGSVANRPQVSKQPAMHPKPDSARGISATWLALVDCESGRRWGIRNYPYEGAPQFHWKTYRAYRRPSDPLHAYDATPAQQIAVAKLVLRGQGPGAWPHCSVVAGLTRRGAA